MFHQLLIKYKVPLAILFLALLFFSFRLPGLGSDMANSDSIRWHRRSTNFLQAIKASEYKETYQQYHPGVTIMLSNALVKEAIFRYDLKTSEEPGLFTHENATYFPQIHKISKSFQEFIIFGLLLMQLYLLTRLFNLKVATLYGIIYSIEPYITGVDRWFHLTSLESNLTFLSVLAILYWRKNLKLKYLLLSAFFFALALLSKITALIALPVIFLVMLNARDCFPVKIFVRNILIFGFLTAFIFVLFFPAMWVAPLYVLSKIWNGAILGGVSDDVRFNPLPGIYSVFYYAVVIFIKSSPIVFLLSLVSLFAKNKPKTLKFILLYFLVYFVALSLSVKKIDRYVISLFPPLLLSISYYLSTLRLKKLFTILILMFIFSFQASFIYAPINSSYYSPLLGTNPIYKAQSLGFYDNSGEYYADAARAMNLFSPNDGSIVWVPHNHESFNAYYFRSSTQSYTPEARYAVTSLDHFKEVQQFCPDLIHSFGPAKEISVGIFSCENVLR